MKRYRVYIANVSVIPEVRAKGRFAGGGGSPATNTNWTTNADSRRAALDKMLPVIREKVLPFVSSAYLAVFVGETANPSAYAERLDPFRIDVETGQVVSGPMILKKRSEAYGVIHEYTLLEMDAIARRVLHGRQGDLNYQKFLDASQVGVNMRQADFAEDVPTYRWFSVLGGKYEMYIESGMRGDFGGRFSVRRKKLDTATEVRLDIARLVREAYPDHTVYDTLPEDVEAIADRGLAASRFGGILRCDDYPVLRKLQAFVDYKGERWTAVRKRVDQLDQVTFSPIKKV